MKTLNKKKRALLIRWILIPSAILALVEVSSRMRQKGERHWYSFRGIEKRGETLEHLFLGSSRVAGSIHCGAFSARILERSGKRPHALNLGRHWSTMAQHLLGLRRLCERVPSALRGTTVWIEAPGGIPNTATWKDPWYLDQAPDYLAPLLRAEDVAKAFREGASLGDTSALASLWLGRVSSTVSSRRKLRAQFFHSGEQTVEQLLELVLPWQEQQAVRADEVIDEAARVEMTRQGLLRARSLMRTIAREATLARKPAVDWKRSIARELALFVKARGGQLVFFRMPISSVQAEMFEGKERKREITEFQRLHSSWGARYLETRIRTTDADFPDLWHLRKSRRTEYSVRLADAWLGEEAAGPR